MRKTSLLLAVAAVFGITATSVQAAPKTETFQATSTILEQLDIDQKVPLAFGKIDKPSSGSADYTISTLGVPSDTGDGGFIGTTATAGSFDILGSNEPVTVSTATEGSCNNDGVTLKNLTLSATSVTLVAGKANVKLGGTLAVTSDALAQVTSCDFMLTAQY